jgi:hypothetical protein
LNGTQLRLLLFLESVCQIGIGLKWSKKTSSETLQKSLKPQQRILRMMSSGMLRRVALIRTDVWEVLNASFIRVTRISELGTKLVVTSNRRTLRRNTECSVRRLLVRASVVNSSQTFVTLMKKALRFLQEPHGVTSQKTPA